MKNYQEYLKYVSIYKNKSQTQKKIVCFNYFFAEDPFFNRGAI